MWILIFYLTWPDGETMNMKMNVMGNKHTCEMLAQETMKGEDVQQAITSTGATVRWECKEG